MSKAEQRARSGWSRRWRRGLAIAGVTLTTGAAAGDDMETGFWERLQGERLQVHGFASLATIKTSANRFYGNSPDWSFDDIEIAVNASYRFNPRLLVSGQVIARKAGDLSDGTPTLDYGLFDLTLDASTAHRIGVRLGRLKNPLGLYNETRDVPFTRPSIFLPQVVYFDKARNLLLSSDGVMFYGDVTTARGMYSLTLGAGQTVTDDNLEWVFLGDDGPGKLQSGGLSWIGSLWYATPNEQWRLGLSVIETALDYDTGGAQDLLRSGTTSMTYSIFSAQYNAEFWTLSGEYMRLPTRYRDYGHFMPYSDLDSEGYYLQAAYRLGPTLEALARYEEGFSDRGDRDGQALSDLTLGSIPRFDFYTHGWTAGLTWNPTKALMLRAQYSRTNGSFTLSPRENDAADLVKDWDLFALQIAVRF